MIIITIDFTSKANGTRSTRNTPFGLLLTGGDIDVIWRREKMSVKTPNLFSDTSELEERIRADAEGDRLKTSTYKDTLLCREIRSSHADFERCEQLIKEGANVNCITFNGDTLLHQAHNSEIADYLIKNGADVDAYSTSPHTGLYTPLHLTVYCSPQQDDMMLTLLLHNADPSIPDQNGDTPLMRLLRLNSPYPSKKIAFLLKYVYDFSYVNAAGSSLLTLAMISEYHLYFAHNIIERGGNFSTLSADLRVLAWCIDHPSSEEFKWFWNIFNYKNTWFFKQPILYYLFKNNEYEAFDFVIQSSKIQDVLDVWFGDHDYKEGTILQGLECQEKEFTLNDILKAPDYNSERAETAIYILLSFGYEPREHELLEIYRIFGNGELFKLCLNFEILEPAFIYNISSLIPKILLNPDRNGQKIVNEWVVSKSDRRRYSFIFTFRTSPFSDNRYRTNELSRDTHRDVLVSQSRQVPSLLELSRNQVLHGIWKQCNVKKRSYFWSVMKHMCLAPMIEDLILFKFPVYVRKQ